jgi:hypothetical protein
MSGSAGLERAYRRLLTCYPRSFRQENGEEVMAVLLATVGDGQRRPGIAESVDLIKGGMRMRMGLSRSPRPVLYAVRLMYLGAVVELGVIVTVLLTEGSIRAAVLQRNPQLTAGQLGYLNTTFTIDIVGSCVGIAVWISLAWANGKGYGLARVVAIAVCAISGVLLLGDVADGTALYAPAALIAGGVMWLIGLAATVLLLQKQSWAYFSRRAAPTPG